MYYPAHMAFIPLELRALDTSQPEGEREVLVLGLDPGRAIAVVIRRTGELSLTNMSHLTAEIHFDPEKNEWVHDWPALVEAVPDDDWMSEELDDSQEDLTADEVDGSPPLPGPDAHTD